MGVKVNKEGKVLEMIDPTVSVPCVVCKTEATYIDEKTRDPLCYKHWKDRGYAHNGSARNFITDEQIKSVGQSMRKDREYNKTHKVKRL